MWAAVLSLLYLLLLATRPAEACFGVPGEWTWSGRPPAPTTVPRWWPAIAVLAGTALGAVALDRRWSALGRRARALALAGLVVAIPLIQLTLKFIHHRYPVAFYLHRTIGPHNGFWQAAVAIESVGDYLRTYPAQMQRAVGTYLHLTTHPPGNVLYLWLWRQTFAAFPNVAHAVAHWLRGYNCADFGFVTLHDPQIAAALGQMLVPLASGLTVLPLYAWGRRLGDARTGWRAAALFALTPSLALFTMRWDTLYPLLAALAFAALHRGLEARPRPRALKGPRPRALSGWFLSGLAVSLASFGSFGNAPLALGIALYAAGYLWIQGPRHVLRAWRGWLALLLGGYSVWAVYHLATGVALWDLLAITARIQVSLRQAYSYGRWLFYNAYDILVFSGIPVGVLFVVAAVRAGARVTQRCGLPKRRQAGLPALAVAGALLVVNLAGLSPGEVGRLWMPWVPGMALAAALWLGRRGPGRGFAPACGLMAAQCLAMSLFLRVSPTGMPSYQPPEPPPDVAAPAHPQDVTFDAGAAHIRLTGYDVRPSRPRPGDAVEATLYWQATSRPDLPYNVFVHLLDGDGALVAQHDGPPADGQRPTSCWRPGEVVPDPHPLTLPADAPPDGPYRLRVGLYYWPTMTRLAIVAGGQGDAITLPLITETEE